MISLKINGTKVECPGCYEELTTGTFQRVFREWDMENPLAKRDSFKLFSILTGTSFAGMQPSVENEATIWNAVGWFVTEPFRFSAQLPKVLQIGDKIISVPRKVAVLSYGQNVMLRQAIDKSKFMEENISIAVAICLQPLYDGGKFDYDRALEIEKLILDMPIYLTHPVGFFLLQTVEKDGRKHQRGLQRRKVSLKQTLKRMWPSWLRSTSSRSLTTCP